MLCKENISQASYFIEWMQTVSSEISKVLTYCFLASRHTVFIWLWNQALISFSHEIDRGPLYSVKIEAWSRRSVETVTAWCETLKENEAFWQWLMSYHKYSEFSSSLLSDTGPASKLREISEMKEILSLLWISEWKLCEFNTFSEQHSHFMIISDWEKKRCWENSECWDKEDIECWKQKSSEHDDWKDTAVEKLHILDDLYEATRVDF